MRKLQEEKYNQLFYAAFLADMRPYTSSYISVKTEGKEQERVTAGVGGECYFDKIQDLRELRRCLDSLNTAVKFCEALDAMDICLIPDKKAKEERDRFEEESDMNGGILLVRDTFLNQEGQHLLAAFNLGGFKLILAWLDQACEK